MTDDRKIITDQVEQVWIIGYTLEDIAKEINDLLERYGPTARLQYENHPDRDIYVEISRPETDEEVLVRKSIENTMRLNAENREREEFKRLQRKFGVK